MDVIGLLAGTGLFQGVSRSHLASLATICMPKSLSKRQTLFLEGQRGEMMYLLAEGDIQLYRDSPDGKEIVIKIVQPGELFAEVVLFERSEYPVSAQALRESLVLMLPRRQILCLLEQESFRNELIGFLMKKQRYLTERIYYLTTHDVEERFYHFLQEQYGKRETYTLELPKRDIAAAVGTTPESLSRLIQRLKQAHQLQWEGKQIRLAPGFWRDRGE